MKTYCVVGKFGGGSLTNLVNHQQFTKLKLFKLAVTICNFQTHLQQTFLPIFLFIQFCQPLSPPNLPTIKIMVTSTIFLNN